MRTLLCIAALFALVLNVWAGDPVTTAAVSAKQKLALPPVQFRPNEQHYDYTWNPGDEAPKVNYDPTNGTVFSPKPPFGEVLNVIRDQNSTMPVRLIYEAVKVKSGVAIRYEIRDEKEISRIMDALASARYARGTWWHVNPGHPEYVYRLTLDFRESEKSTGPFVDSITLNLSHMVKYAFDFSALEAVLAKYPPGFRPQAFAVLQ